MLFMNDIYFRRLKIINPVYAHAHGLMKLRNGFKWIIITENSMVEKKSNFQH